MTNKATFAAGCFWGVEAAFRKISGVTQTTVGFMGGATEHATYEEVCSGSTGHAEVCQLDFDSTVVSYEQLLELFWSIHDPTQLNRQGADHGSQYRSAIYCHSEDQLASAEASKQKLSSSGKHSDKVVTQIESATEYILAEEYHQQYFEKNGIESCPI